MREKLTGPVAALRRRLFGCFLCAGIAAVAVLVEMLEVRAVGHRLIDALVISLLLGIGLRMFYTPSCSAAVGIDFTGKPVMNMAVVVLGLTVNVRQFYGEQLALVLFATGSVVVGFFAAAGIARSLRLPGRTSTLIATGASICGNSAIAAAAPAIRATKGEVAAAISISALLGVAQVVAFPVVRSVSGLDDQSYGFLAGISIYSVPQAVAAAFAVNETAGEVATTTKLARVLMLGPMVLALGVMARRTPEAPGIAGAAGSTPLVPNFVLGFVALAAAGALFELPDWLVGMARATAIALFTVAMAAIGLEVRVADLLRGAPKAGVAVLLSMAVMVSLGVIGIRLLDL